MKILLKSFGGDAPNQQVIQRLQAVLAHWADRLGRVVVRLTDANGPKGGVDKVCSIQLEVLRQEPLRVTAVSPDHATAVELAIRRAGRMASRTFDRRSY